LIFSTFTFFIIVFLLSMLQTFLARYEAFIFSLIAPAIWTICMFILYYTNEISMPILIGGLIAGILILSISRLSAKNSREEKRKQELNDMKKKDF